MSKLDSELERILNDFGNEVQRQSSWMSLGGEFEPRSDPIAGIKEVFYKEYPSIRPAIKGHKDMGEGFTHHTDKEDDSALSTVCPCRNATHPQQK